MAELPFIIMQTTSYFSWVSNDTIDFEIACLSSELQSEKIDKCKFSIYFLNKIFHLISHVCR